MASARVCLLFALCFVASFPGFLGVQPPAFKKGAKESFSKIAIEADGSFNLQKASRRRRSRRRRSRRRGVQRDSVNADYGGTSHQDDDPSDTQSNGLPEVWRPEAVKSERCGDTACHMCSHKTDDGCWYGKTQGDMMLAVQAHSLFKSFALEVFFKCSNDNDGGGKFQMRVRAINNGEINVYVNKNLVREIPGPIHKPTNFKFTFETATARVRAVFVPIDRNSPSSAEAKIEVLALAPAADRCMTTTNCMSALGDGTDAGFELRNNNTIQQKCLESGASSLQGQQLQAKCRAWEACLPEENKRNLKTLLKVAIPSGLGSLADVASTASGNLTVSDDPNECINPAVDDPESWDCECVEDMLDSCGGADESDEACFQRIMCNSAEVCQSWKDAVQCTALIQTNKDGSGVHTGDLNAALGQRGREHASSGIDNALDGSLHGKCSQ